MSLFYSNPLGGRDGFFLNSVRVRWHRNSAELFWIFEDFTANFLRDFPPPTLAHFLNIVYFFNMIWIFLWHINVFNVRQDSLTRLLYVREEQDIILQEFANNSIVGSYCEKSYQHFPAKVRKISRSYSRKILFSTKITYLGSTVSRHEK